jgi:hypothetical protein
VSLALKLNGSSSSSSVIVVVDAVVAFVIVVAYTSAIITDNNAAAVIKHSMMSVPNPIIISLSLTHGDNDGVGSDRGEPRVGVDRHRLQQDAISPLLRFTLSLLPL